MDERRAPHGCGEALNDLVAWLDGELQPEAAARVRAHVELCIACAREAKDLRGTWTAMEAVKVVPAGAGAAAALAASIIATEAAPGAAPVARIGSSRIAIAAVATIAAAVAISVSLALFGGTAPRPGPRTGPGGLASASDAPARADPGSRSAPEATFSDIDPTVIALLVDLGTDELEPDDLDVIENLDLLENMDLLLSVDDEDLEQS